MTCGAFPQDSNLSSIKLYGSTSLPFGPGKELAFPRLVEGKPTIGPQDKTIRLEPGYDTYSFAGAKGDSGLNFKIEKLIRQGKPDY